VHNSDPNPIPKRVSFRKMWCKNQEEPAELAETPFSFARHCAPESSVTLALLKQTYE